MDDHSTPACPFCPFADRDATFVAQHIEYCHPEGGGQPSFSRDTHAIGNASPVPESSPVDEESTDKYVDCPHECGEVVTTAELSIHLDLHVAENIALDDSGVSQSDFARDVSSEPDISSDLEDSVDFNESRKGGKKGADRDFTRTNTSKPARARSPVGKVGSNGAKRLGRSELGPHAHEKKMPSWLRKMLEKGGRTSKQTQITADGRLARRTTVENETENLIPVIAKLCEQDPSSRRVFLCSSKVRHICKMPREGGFCGYRNIQMLVSYITKAKAIGHEHFPEGLPTILQLQDMIELAWDRGFNSSGRTETGGIRGTRKFIGTPEAQALFMSLDIPCDASSITEARDRRAYDALYMDVAAYYHSVCSLDDPRKVFMTDLPPIYFQHQGHSMSIIGFEIRDNGSANLLVFDPMFKTSPVMYRLIGSSARSDHPARLLKAYRRGSSYLQKYKMFELLKKISVAMGKRANPNIIVTGTPGVGKTVHCEKLAEDLGLKHLSVNQVAKERNCFDGKDKKRGSDIVDEDKLLDAIEHEVLLGGYLIDWHACDLFPKSWIDLVVVLRCPETTTLYDRLASRGYAPNKLEENIDAEIFGVLMDEAREAFDEEIVVELNSEKDSDVESNCDRIAAWVNAWWKQNAEDADDDDEE
ncbi:hypothetical protein N7532_007440 [Penicillium argentinense]|uniref:Adenylate kinase isoenzyme 6 homolog n=1 Tax=Penicillium argentinense TaxID=1131581 RepID=A0A9W9F7Y2_9EURO|nr:uncharacterized protein N7532_007440 [Penicillium argentinense]KAJ5095149.1 hypothetical protein N7532_007440 [Penicillium argentinense]